MNVGYTVFSQQMSPIHDYDPWNVLTDIEGIFMQDESLAKRAKVRV